ncbi:MAG: MCP four helix bundle domain-containing protein [bacterium]
MGLRLKILSGFLILATMLLIAGVWSIYEITSLGTSVPKLLNENYKSINMANKMMAALEREDSAILLLLSGNWKQGRNILTQADSAFQDEFKNAQQNLTIPGEAAHLDSIKATYQIYKELWDRPIVGTNKQGDLDWYFAQMHRAFSDVKAAVHKLLLLNEQSIYGTASKLQNRANRAIMPGVVAIVAALIFTLIFNYFVHFYVTDPIVKITKRVKKFVERKVPFEIEIESQDEFQDLVFAIKTLCALLETPEAQQ